MASCIYGVLIHEIALYATFEISLNLTFKLNPYVHSTTVRKN